MLVAPHIARSAQAAEFYSSVGILALKTGTACGVDRSEKGFTLIEVMIVAALSSLVLVGAFEVVRTMLAASRTVAQRTQQYTEMETFVDRLVTEARTAEAVTLPVSGCAAIEMYARDPGPNGAPHFWSYRYDARVKTIVRNASTVGALSPCTLTGGTVVAQNITAFMPSAVPIIGTSGLAGRADAPYIASGGVTNVTFPLGVYEADGTTYVNGGNALVEVQVVGPVSARTVDLAAGVTPSGYTLTLQYTCNARCDPTLPHDGARIDSCIGTYAFQAPTTQAYVTHTTLIHPNDPNPPLWPPGVPAWASFAFPDTWQIVGYFDFHYSGADTRDQLVPFSVSVPGNKYDPANGYYPAFVAPYDTNSAAQLIAHVAAIPQAAVDQSAACSALSTSPVYHND